MIKNYFKTALRNLLRYKGFTLLNILGLSLAITASLIIALFVHDERQYDKFIRGGENVYRFYTERNSENGNTLMTPVPPIFATYVQQYPEIESSTRILMTPGRRLIEADKVKTYEDKGLVVDSTFFNVFPLQFLKGDPASALMDPNAVVLTDETAKKYFGSAEPIGKTIRINNKDFVIRGVLTNTPEHFHLEMNYVMPLSAAKIEAERMKSWGWNQFMTYVKVKPGTNLALLQSKFQQDVKRELDKLNNDRKLSYVPFLQPLKDIHLYSSDFVYDNAKRGNITYVKGLIIIAIFLLLIACFNFINLATARSMRRAKEIGVRKVVGAEKKQLIFQFTGETILLSLISIFIAVLAALFLLPLVNNFTAKAISFNPFADPGLLILLLSAAIGIGIIAGVYPAFVMSGFQPIKVLKGLKLANRQGSSQGLRKSLVVVQFALSALLVISTLIVYKQINFLHQKNLGFNKDQVIYFSALGSVSKNPEAFKSELLRSSGIVAVTAGYGLPGDMFAGDAVKVEGKFDDKEQPVSLFVADYDYIKTLGMHIIAGRDFSKDYSTDAEQAFIVNETAVKDLGFETPEKALGQKISWNKWIPDSANPVKRGEVIGVVKDFHYKSFYEKVNPAVLMVYPPVVVKVAVKVKTANLSKTIDDIKAAWNKFSPDFPMDYNFLDENFAKMYQSEDKLGGLLWVFTIVAIFVGCIGLFGLSAFSAEQRIKEIGIRKVLGASARNIVTLLSKNFIQLIILSLLIASPIAWWIMNRWLRDFAYKVNIGWGVFILAGSIALLVALLTVSFQAIKAAIANPIKSLRTE